MGNAETIRSLNEFNDTVLKTTSDDKYLVPVEVLCVTCKQPIKATITTPQWLRVEWISPSGECQACNREAKEASRG